VSLLSSVWLSYSNPFCESTITLDPHKSGYVPYPAGGLCIRDERHRFLTTWTSPFINVNQGNDIAMGIYGVEGRLVQIYCIRD